MTNVKIRKKLCIVALISLAAMIIFSMASFADDIVAWCDYEDGVVNDGAVGDEPGIIGDERVNRDASPNDNSSNGANGNDGTMSRSAANGANGNDGTMGRSAANGNDGGNISRTAAGTNGDNDMMTFWGIVLALAIGAAAILVSVLAFPTKSRNGKG